MKNKERKDANRNGRKINSGKSTNSIEFKESKGIKRKVMENEEINGN
jgi:hypothetical protein